MKSSNLPVNQLMGLIRMLPPELKQTLAQLLAQETDQGAAQVEDEDLDLWEEDDEDWDEEDEDWDDDEEEEWEEDEGLERRMLLAADNFGYNYASYEDNLGNSRFDEILPREIDILEKAEAEDWDDERLAAGLEADVADVPLRRRLFRRAVQIVDAPSPAESFRRAVRFAIQDAVAEGLEDEEAVENLVGEICSRAADLGYLLGVTAEPLLLYSKELCQEDEPSPYTPLPAEDSGS